MSAAVKPDAAESKTLVVRGVTYTIRELTAGEYDECIRGSTNAEDEVDTVLLGKLMAMKAVDPRMTDEQLAKLPFRVWRALNRAVNEMHYVIEETKEGND